MNPRPGRTLMLVGELGQWLGVLVMIGGALVEHLSYHAIGSGTLVVGAFLWGGATKVKYYLRRRRDRDSFHFPFGSSDIR